jgi:hypothetical protein
MHQVFNYYTRFQGVRGQVGGLPQWARFVLALFALPGILLVVLSILALVVSILALLLLTAPVYRLLLFVTGSGTPERDQQDTVTAGGSPSGMGEPSPGRRHIDVTIIE